MHEQATAQDADHRFMRRALDLAVRAAEKGEVPVGAVVVVRGVVVGEGANQRETERDPMAHAEVQALRSASRRLGRWRLSDATLYVTLEPCPMCAGALVNARIERLVYATRDPKAGAVRSLFRLVDDPRLNHQVAFREGVLEEPAAELLRAFFRARRTKKVGLSTPEADARSHPV